MSEFYTIKSKKNMLLQTLLSFCFWICLATGAAASAVPLPGLTPQAGESKPVAVVYFNNGSAIANDHAAMIESMIQEAGTNLGLTIEGYALPDESELAGQIEKIADTDTGFIIIIEPHDIEALSRIPGLYPDIKFSVIGIARPLYLTNVRSMLFNEPEGAYLMGVLSALHSRNGVVSFVSKDDNDTTRNLAYAFLQGIRYTRNDVQVIERLGSKTTVRSGNITSEMQEPAGPNADIVFVLDENLLPAALHTARVQKQLVITNNHSLTDEHPTLVLTSLLKHYDLAMYRTLRSYRRGEWRAGSESMGIGDSSIDYVLDNDNKAYIPKEMIEQIEMVKDYVSQGIITIDSLQKE